MLDKKTIEVVSNNPEMMEIINVYMENDMKLLKNICRNVWYGKIDNSDYDELYDVAVDCLMMTVAMYNKDRALFKTYLTGNIMRKTSTWMRDNKYRLKRNNLLKDANGKLILDEEKNPQIIVNISLDMDTDEARNIKNTLSSRENIEEEVFAEEYTDKVELYFRRLPKKQEKIARLLSQQYTKDEIVGILHITPKEYNEQLQGLRKYEYISILF